MILGRIAIVATALFAPPTYAQHSVDATVLSAYDGDTFTAKVEVWPDFTWEGSVRVRGVDTAEIQGECDIEIAWAILARDYVIGLLQGQQIILTDIEEDQYGRALANVVLESGEDLSQLIIQNGYAREYDGTTARQSWCDGSVLMPVT